MNQRDLVLIVSNEHILHLCIMGHCSRLFFIPVKDLTSAFLAYSQMPWLEVESQGPCVLGAMP